MSDRDEAVRFTQHYFRLIARKAGLAWDSGEDVEIEILVDHIIAAAAEQIRAEMKREAEASPRPADVPCVWHGGSGPACGDCTACVRDRAAEDAADEAYDDEDGTTASGHVLYRGTQGDLR